MAHFDVPTLGTLESEILQGQRPSIPIPQLTPRETDVLQLIGVGLHNPAIAKLLQISIRTVEFHRSNLQKKFAVRNTILMVRMAIKMGFIPL